VTGAAWPYCLQCAKPARLDLGPALDGRSRVILCEWDDPKGYPRGHGRTLGTTDLDLAMTLVERHRLERLVREHPGHRTASGHHAECPTCRRKGPHLDHLIKGRTAAGCADCDRAHRRAGAAHVGA